MPMIDVYAPNDLLPSGSDRRIGEALTRAALRAEGVAAPSPYYLENTMWMTPTNDVEPYVTGADPRKTSIRSTSRRFRVVSAGLNAPPHGMSSTTSRNASNSRRPQNNAHNKRRQDVLSRHVTSPLSRTDATTRRGRLLPAIVDRGNLPRDGF